MNVFDLFAKLSLDTSEYEEELGEAREEAEKGGGKIGAALGTAAKVGAAAIAAGASAITAVTKSAIDSYADYEQLVGGVETLFGDSAEQVIEDANNAFKTAGMSVNDYMETSIQSAASLINSLGGDQKKAAELMNLSITDMADNVNKMGTTMESVQNAYRGFSRGNFTMLDNLALGFAGTKEGMQELLDKAQELSGIEYDIDSYSDIVQAIHVVQTEMGITGTTAKEASETISGSIASMKSAWQNLITGIADENANMGQLIDNVVESAETAAQNLLPRINQTLSGIGQVITGLAPVITTAVPQLITDVLPSLLIAAASLIKAIGSALIGSLPQLLDVGIELVFTLVDGIIDALPELIPAVVAVILTVVEKLTEPSTLMQVIQAGFQIIGAIAKGLIQAVPVLIEKVPVIITNLVEAILSFLPQIFESGVQMIAQIGKGIASAFPGLVAKISEWWTNIKDVTGTAWETISSVASEKAAAMGDMLKGKWNSIKSAYDEHGKGLKGIAAAAVEAVKQKWTLGFDTINTLTGGKLNGIKDLFNRFSDNVKNIFNRLVQAAVSWGRDLIQSFINGIKQKWEALKSTVRNIANTVKNYLGFSEPKEGPLSDFHTYAPDMMALFAKGIRDNEKLVTDQLQKSFQFDNSLFAGGAAEKTGGEPAAAPVIYLTALFEMDGEVISRKTYQYNQNEISRHGMSLVKA